MNVQHSLCVLSESGAFMAKMTTKLRQHNPGDYNMKAACWRAGATGCNLFFFLIL